MRRLIVLVTVLFALVGAAAALAQGARLRHLNPPSLSTPTGYTHIVAPLRGRLVPLIHLGALLSGTAALADPVAGVRTVVLVEIGGGAGGGGPHAQGAAGRQVAFEVDDADAVVREQPLPVPRGQTLPWAVGVAEQGEGEGLVPILDLDALGDRIL